jgi:hypothetical protein
MQCHNHYGQAKKATFLLTSLFWHVPNVYVISATWLLQDIEVIA